MFANHALPSSLPFLFYYCFVLSWLLLLPRLRFLRHFHCYHYYCSQANHLNWNFYWLYFHHHSLPFTTCRHCCWIFCVKNWIFLYKKRIVGCGSCSNFRLRPSTASSSFCLLKNHHRHDLLQKNVSFLWFHCCWTDQSSAFLCSFSINQWTFWLINAGFNFKVNFRFHLFSFTLLLLVVVVVTVILFYF